MKLRPLIFSSLIGTLTQVGLGTVINVISYFPIRTAAATGTFGEPWVPFGLFALQLGILGLMVDVVSGWLTGRWGGSAREGAIAGGLTQLIGGLLNGSVALIVLYVALQQTAATLGATVQGLGESYSASLLLVAGIGGGIGWLIGVGAGAMVGSVGGRVGARVRPRG